MSIRMSNSDLSAVLARIETGARRWEAAGDAKQATAVREHGARVLAEHRPKCSDCGGTIGPNDPAPDASGRCSRCIPPSVWELTGHDENGPRVMCLCVGCKGSAKPKEAPSVADYFTVKSARPSNARCDRCGRSA